MPGFEPVPTDAIQSLTKDPADAAWLLEIEAVAAA